MYSFIARQPILNAEKVVVAYELLFRDGESNSFPDVDPDQATSNILTNNHLTMGVEEITTELPAFINFHSNALIKNFPTFLDPTSVVIEILEDVPASDELLVACKQLHAKGYKLALDDHDFDPKWGRFLPYISILKIDILDYSILEVNKQIRKLQNTNMTLLAEKVETQAQFEQFKLMGFSLFQGYFFSKPEMLKQKRLTNTKQNILRLIGYASSKTLDFDAMGEIFSSDPALTYKLLRFINSPYYGRSQDITSLKHALIYIGDLELKKFIALLALADLSQGKPPEIMRLSLIRAKFCEKIALSLHAIENPPKAFLTGILSLIDGILDRTLDTVLNILPVHHEIKSALLDSNNHLAEYLALSKIIESGNWQQSLEQIQKLGVTENECLMIHKDAMAWADEMMTL